MWFVEGGLVVVATLVIASPLRRLRDLPTEPGSRPEGEDTGGYSIIDIG